MAKHTTTIAERFVQWANRESPATGWEDITGTWEDQGGGKATSVLAEIVDTTRWTVVHRQVFRMADDSYVEVTWNAPATEYQDQDPECSWSVVERREVVTFVYEKRRA